MKPTMARFMREQPLHLDGCRFREAPYWLASEQMMEGQDKRHWIDGELVCVMCGAVLDSGQEPKRAAGPKYMLTREEVDAERARLIQAGRPHGTKSIAESLGFSESTVKRRLQGN